jgi:hypothetical protein
MWRVVQSCYCTFVSIYHYSKKILTECLANTHKPHRTAPITMTIIPSSRCEVRNHRLLLQRLVVVLVFLGVLTLTRLDFRGTNVGLFAGSLENRQAESIHLLLQQQQSGATGSLFLGKVFREFPGEAKFRDSQPKLTEPDEDSTYTSNANLRSGQQASPKKHQRPSSLRPTHTSPECTKWSVVTTIFAPSEAVLRAAQLSVNGWCMVIVADLVTPPDYLEVAGLSQNSYVHFLSVDYQKRIGSSGGNESAVAAFVRAIPWRHFSRKNIGYLYAMANQAQFIFDFDDDNILDYNGTTNKRANNGEPTMAVVDPVPERLNAVRVPLSAKNALNHHPLMGLRDSWPRGFPLDLIQDTATQGPMAFELNSTLSTDDISRKIAVLQYCVNANPDVDAIHRLVKPLPLNFESASPLMIPPHTFAPYNAQATVHMAPAFFATLLPSTVPGRVSDIWRSYFAQVLFFPLDLAVTFLPPRIVQERNEHAYLGDFQAESDLYIKASVLVDYLATWEPSESAAPIPARMEELWMDLYGRGYIEVDDVHLLQLWLAALAEIGYIFPSIPKQRQRRHHNVVVMGQFNYAEPVDNVVFWTQKWRTLFSNIVVRGPFDAETMKELQARGVNVYETTVPNDNGLYSPMTNLGETLLHYYNSNRRQQDDEKNDDKLQRRIDGVMYIHDDAMLDIWEVIGSDERFPGDILGSLYSLFPYSYQDPRNLVEVPDLSRYSYYMRSDGSTSISLTDRLNWCNWPLCTPGIESVMATDDPVHRSFLEPDGSFVVPSPTQADFLFVPIQYARVFHEAARVMVRHQIFLECGFPIIVDHLVQQQNRRQQQLMISTSNTTTVPPPPLKIHTIDLCTTWDPPGIRGTDQMYTECKADTRHTYGMYHPFKLSSGLEWWGNLFDTITFGGQ